MSVALASRDLGQGAPVLVLHGLLGQGRNWQAIAKRLATGRALRLLDLRNHGASPWAAPMTYPAMVEDLVAVADAGGFAGVSLVGHSMGGKAAMAMALAQPQRVERLVVVDVAPVRYRHGDFERYMRAMAALDLAALGRRSAVESALLPVDPDPRIRAFLSSNLEVQPRALRWLPNLELLLHDLPAILDFPAELMERRFEGPVLFLSGERSTYLRAEDEPLVRRLFPEARIVRIADAGHWVHADQPERVVQELDAFLPREI